MKRQKAASLGKQATDRQCRYGPSNLTFFKRTSLAAAHNYSLERFLSWTPRDLPLRGLFPTCPRCRKPSRRPIT